MRLGAGHKGFVCNDFSAQFSSSTGNLFHPKLPSPRPVRRASARLARLQRACHPDSPVCPECGEGNESFRKIASNRTDWIRARMPQDERSTAPRGPPASAICEASTAILERNACSPEAPVPDAADSSTCPVWTPEPAHGGREARLRRRADPKIALRAPGQIGRFLDSPIAGVPNPPGCAIHQKSICRPFHLTPAPERDRFVWWRRAFAPPFVRSEGPLSACLHSVTRGR
jgi:hypothetical protein